jgi:hypothetical protein
LDEAKAQLDREGIQNPETRLLAFMAAEAQETQDCNIFAHEGRHAIDRALGIIDSAMLEFRAKLSEIAFAQHPKAMLRQAYNANTGNDTPHGQGQLKLMKGILFWMEAHAAEIHAFDGKRPTLPQLDLLTDEQLRRAIRSMDPLSKDFSMRPKS